MHDHVQGNRAPYCVRVGFVTVDVVARDVRDAIRRARRVLCRDMPRLFDVITSLDESHFRVEPVPLDRRRAS